MTRAEAAKICQSIKFMMDKDDYSEEVEEALDMAMEALEQEETLQNLTRPNKSDLISRQAAIDAVFGRSHDIIKQRLKILPTAQPFTEDQIQTMQELESAQVEKAYELGKADRPTGHWIENDNGTFSCSNCQSWIPKEQHHYARHCLYCGARMESEEE